MLLWEALLELLYPSTVSYTHLDVYKRQILRICCRRSWRPGRPGGISLWRQSLKPWAVRPGPTGK